MALDRLLALITTQGVEPKKAAIARWTETPELADWEAEPEYGSFVDDEGRIVTGSQPYRAFLESDDASRFRLVPEAERRLGGCHLVFLDWGRQPLSWEEIFELWAAWDTQGMIVDCGNVGVPWALADRWVAPCWIAFRDGFDGSPLTTVAQTPPEAPSFLARALELRSTVVSDEELPMLPFTLADLHNPAHAWPAGVA
jgi:hypothetical protein